MRGLTLCCFHSFQVEYLVVKLTELNTVASVNPQAKMHNSLWILLLTRAYTVQQNATGENVDRNAHYFMVTKCNQYEFITFSRVHMVLDSDTILRQI